MRYRLLAVLTMLLLSGCFTLGGYESSKTAEGDSRTKAALVDVGTDTVGAMEAGARATTRGIEAARAERAEAQEQLNEARAQEADVDARIDAALDYESTLTKLRDAIVRGAIIEPDKSAIQGIVRQRQSGALTRAQANAQMQTFVARYSL